MGRSMSSPLAKIKKASLRDFAYPYSRSLNVCPGVIAAQRVAVGKGKGEGAEVGNGNTARDPSPVVQVSGGIYFCGNGEVICTLKRV